MTHPHIIGMQFFYYSTRGSSASSVDITAIRASLVHMHHTDLGIVAPGSHKLCLQFVCSPCGLRIWCRSSTDSFWFHTGRACSLLLIHGFTTNTTFIHYFELKSKHCYWKSFQHCDLLLSKYSKSIFYTCLNARNISNALFNAFTSRFLMFSCSSKWQHSKIDLVWKCSLHCFRHTHGVSFIKRSVDFFLKLYVGTKARFCFAQVFGFIKCGNLCKKFLYRSQSGEDYACVHLLRNHHMCQGFHKVTVTGHIHSPDHLQPAIGTPSYTHFTQMLNVRSTVQLPELA